MSDDAFGASNYLKMEGSIYIPMSATDSSAEKLPEVDETEDQAKGYADKLRRRISSAGEAIPLKPMQKVEPVVRSESSPATSNLPPREEHCAVPKLNDGSPKETTALVHHEGESSPAITANGSDISGEAAANVPFLPPAPPQRVVPMRPKKGGNSNESIGSSGFHSDYIPDMDSAPPNYDLVMRNGHASEDVSTV